LWPVLVQVVADRQGLHDDVPLVQEDGHLPGRLAEEPQGLVKEGNVDDLEGNVLGEKDEDDSLGEGTEPHGVDGDYVGVDGGGGAVIREVGGRVPLRHAGSW